MLSDACPAAGIYMLCKPTFPYPAVNIKRADGRQPLGLLGLGTVHWLQPPLPSLTLQILTNRFVVGEQLRL